MWKRFLLSCVIVGFVTAAIVADNDNSKNKSASDNRIKQTEKRSPKQPPKLTPAREAAATAFVRKNHPELEELLIYLKEKRDADYRRAVFDLYRTSERLALYQDRGDTERYKLELKHWQSQSRMQLIVARLKMGNNDELRSELKATLAEKMDLRAAILQRDRDKLAERMKRLDEQIHQLTQDRDSEIDRQVRLLTRSSKTKKVSAPLRSSSQAKASDKPTKSNQPKKN